MVKMISKVITNIKYAVRVSIKSKKGAIDPIIAIIFGAILILAVIAIDPTIRSVFTNAATAFSTWFSTKLNGILT